MSFQQCGKCKEIYDNVVPHSCKIDPAIAARDRWWIEKIQSYVVIEHGAIFAKNIIITPNEWENLKKRAEYER